MAGGILKKVGIAGGATSSCIATLVAATSIGLNIWNVVICKKGLEHTKASCPDVVQLQAFFIGSLVCSALSLLTCGITVPVPHLVFAILGQVWRHIACGDASTLISSSIHDSVIVLWFTFAGNLVLLVAFCCLPCCLVAASSDE